jgi:hypothetical protein
MDTSSKNFKQYALPDRATVRSYLKDLITEKRSCEEVAEWASHFILGDYDHIEVTDGPAWQMLITLSGADLKASPTEYLYVKEDFEDWMERLR